MTCIGLLSGVQLLVIPKIGSVFGDVGAASERTRVSSNSGLRIARHWTSDLVFLGSASLGRQFDESGVGPHDLEFQAIRDAFQSVSGLNGALGFRHLHFTATESSRGRLLLFHRSLFVVIDIIDLFSLFGSFVVIHLRLIWFDVRLVKAFRLVLRLRALPFGHFVQRGAVSESDIETPNVILIRVSIKQISFQISSMKANDCENDCPKNFIINERRRYIRRRDTIQSGSIIN